MPIVFLLIQYTVREEIYYTLQFDNYWGGGGAAPMGLV